MDDRIKVGTKCYLKAQGNAERRYRGRHIDEWIKECEITKVGRKYFTVGQGIASIKYNIETLEEVTDGCSDWKFFFNKQDIYDEEEKQNLIWKIRNKIVSVSIWNCDLSLDQLRRIESIIDESK